MKQYKAPLLIDYSTFVRVSDVGCSGVHGLCMETVLLHIALPSPSLSRSHQAGFPSRYIAFLTPVYLHLSSFLSSCISLIHRLSNPILQKQIPFFSQITFFEVLNICNPANQPFGFLCQGYQSSQTRLHFFTSDTQREFNGLSR